MLFLTILFLATSFTTLIKGKLFYQTIIDIAEEEIRKHTKEDYLPSKELVPRIISLIIFGITYAIMHLAYLTNAVGIDPLKYPSLIMLLWIVFGFIFNYKSNKNKIDYSNKEQVNKYRSKVHKKRTLKGTLKSLISLTYFIYMIYIIVF